MHQSRIRVGLVMLAAFLGSASPVFAQHKPPIGGLWIASTNQDSSPDHVPVAKYRVCFIYTGPTGTHDRYHVYISGSSGWAKGEARQEGDQVFLFADGDNEWQSHLTSQWSVVEGPKGTPMMGAGHWIEWGSYPYPFHKPIPFRNVRYDKVGDCKCIDKECTEVE